MGRILPFCICDIIRYSEVEYMNFNWINVFNLIILVIMMLPNIEYARRFSGVENKCKNKLINILEQIGRYSCLFLMIFPLGVWKFGFTSVTALIVCIIGNIVLLGSYIVVWFFYFKKPSLCKALALALLPTGIFCLSGIVLHHTLLIISSILFGISHTYITHCNN